MVKTSSQQAAVRGFQQIRPRLISFSNGSRGDPVSTRLVLESNVLTSVELWKLDVCSLVVVVLLQCLSITQRSADLRCIGELIPHANWQIRLGFPAHQQLHWRSTCAMDTAECPIATKAASAATVLVVDKHHN